MANNTVLINVPFVESLIDSKGWSNGYFGAKIMGKSRGWVAEWKRKKDGEPAPKNLPTYEEAAKICIVFNASPDNVLLHEGKDAKETAKCLEDIETVRKLVEAEGIKKAPATEGEGEKDALIEAVRGITDKDTALAVFDELSKKMRELM